jgi:hypothetical protein
MNPLTRTVLASVAAIAVATPVVAATAGDHAAAPSAASARPPGPDPSTFHHRQANPWFPLRPGTRWVLHGTEDGHRLLQRTTVTDHTRRIAGVRTRVVRDVVRRADGSVAELTRDWYAADDRGRVWYFGEATATYRRDGSVIDRDGSWQAGRSGAVAGLIVPAHPRVTKAFRQEYDRGNAEDQAWVVERGVHVTTPGVSTRHGLRMLEWTRLEPRVVSTKLYVRGVGIVAEHDLSGGNERYELVSFHRG